MGNCNCGTKEMKSVGEPTQKVAPSQDELKALDEMVRKFFKGAMRN